MGETVRRRTGQLRVRIKVPEGLSSARVREGIEILLGEALPRITMERHHFLVECPNEGMYRTLLGFDGLQIDEQYVFITKAEYSMSGDEILNFVRNLLDQEDELRILQKSNGGEGGGGRQTQSPYREGREIRGEIFA